VPLIPLLKYSLSSPNSTSKSPKLSSQLLIPRCPFPLIFKSEVIPRETDGQN
uniref:Uncharacterized protein n=1 Tax=Triticum urartu TaxID=4572 RepID=A0A8R7Q1A6_TRIUA